MGFSSTDANSRPKGKCPMGFGPQDDEPEKPLSWGQWIKRSVGMKFATKEGRWEIFGWCIVGLATVLALKKAIVTPATVVGAM
jgi:hypothetical protein